MAVQQSASAPQQENAGSPQRKLPADRRLQVSQAYRKLLQMSPDQRTQYFNSDEFRNGFNDEQRNLLRGMAELYPSLTH